MGLLSNSCRYALIRKRQEGPPLDAADPLAMDRVGSNRDVGRLDQAEISGRPHRGRPPGLGDRGAALRHLPVPVSDALTFAGRLVESPTTSSTPV